MRDRLKALFCATLLSFCVEGAAAREPQLLGMSYGNLVAYYPGFSVVTMKPKGGTESRGKQRLFREGKWVSTYLSEVTSQFMKTCVEEGRRLAKEAGVDFYGVSNFHVQFELDDDQVVIDSGADILALRKK